MDDPEIFDRNARRMQRARALRQGGAPSPFMTRTYDDLIERLADSGLPLDNVLVWNAAALPLIDWLESRGAVVSVADPALPTGAIGIRGDEDMTPLPPQSYGAIISVGLLDTVNDLPGALILMRKALRPGGLVLASFIGAETGPALRAALRQADPATQRAHPLIDARGGGDLLVRAGFVRPVADRDDLEVRYSSFDSMIADLRAHAATNVLARRRPLTRATVSAIREAMGGTGFSEMLHIVTLSARTPS